MIVKLFNISFFCYFPFFMYEKILCLTELVGRMEVNFI